MFSLNRAQIVGNVTRDPELRYTPNGQAVCSFSVATNRRWRDKDGNNQEQAEFHNIVAWGKLAELMGQLTHKGTKMYVEGRMQTRSWEGQDGNQRNRTEIVMDDFIVFTPKGAAGAGAGAGAGADADAGPDATDFPPADKKAPEKPKGSDKKAPTSDESESRPESVGKESPAEDEINLDEIPF